MPFSQVHALLSKEGSPLETVKAKVPLFDALVVWIFMFGDLRVVDRQRDLHDLQEPAAHVSFSLWLSLFTYSPAGLGQTTLQNPTLADSALCGRPPRPTATLSTSSTATSATRTSKRTRSQQRLLTCLSQSKCYQKRREGFGLITACRYGITKGDRVAILMRNLPEA